MPLNRTRQRVRAYGAADPVQSLPDLRTENLQSPDIALTVLPGDERGDTGETFDEPEAVFTEAPTVLGTDGVRKMSKSVGNTIEILAEPDMIRKEVMSMVTDTQRILRTQPGRPEVCNVCQLHRFFGPDYEEIWDGERTARTGCVDTKRLLAERIIAHYAPARERYLDLMDRPAELDAILQDGADRLAPKAAATMDDVRRRMGLR